MKTYDITIVGAGPVGLYAAFYAGMRGLSVHIIEAFDQVGGQPRSLYPEKHIYDIATHPAITGEALAKNLLKQLERVDYDLSLSTRIDDISKNGDVFELSSAERLFKSRSVLLTTGAGRIVPRPAGIEGEEDWKTAGKLHYFVPSLEAYRGQKLAILGGGDSAVDWALMLEGIASEVHLIHRRPDFRAHEHSVQALEKSSVFIHTPFKAVQLDKSLEIKEVKGDREEVLEIDQVLVNFGFLTQPQELAKGLEVNRNGHIPVDRQMKTNIDGLYVAGDVADYEGKVPLISVGFGEAVLAINSIQQKVSFDHAFKKGHSSSLFDGD
ncbi:NAD(P)/FAD-dependent oxidoreductase [Lactococcus termiticola]|uniref:Ferredoxin--NADP reductase n=1 Tax=Lactococcus termiticola TaxID=2169526 RepID=A0A2R5HGL8_9LACT|nr:NAD(P)/FAD-dependent oxidoreductase [Lactococcus termiticola]GBG97132.1 thioredoxin reductase [Lactococcus termiticola]